MVKSLENGSSVAPFLLKIYEMVSDESTDELISWSQTHSNSFIIWDVSRFSSELLPKHFKHSNFSSFVRQLNIYGFHKSDTDRWEFSNDEFVKGQRHLLKNIVRRKQTPAQAQRKSSQQKDADPGASEEDRRTALRKEVETLKIDKNTLMQELIKLKQHQQTSQSKLVLVRDQLKGMEKNQQQMLSFIVMVMQNPGFFIQLLQPKENNWRAAETGKHKFSTVDDDCEPLSSDGAIIRYQLPANEPSEPPCIAPSSSSEKPVELDLSDEIRDLLLSVDFTPLPLDEKMLSLENHGPLVLPDSPGGDFLMDQLLLSCPLAESKDTDEPDSEVYLDTGMDIESAFQAQESNKLKSPKDGSNQNRWVDTTGIRNQLDNLESLDFLTV
ncbi:heat stress transcription factor A-8 [Coffea arabica]|uniref:Heat stress transcription factor A-8 n=1 Tax=Coffea arabica TaxID=13443 RepID=A0A6P6V5A9_COFAR